MLSGRRAVVKCRPRTAFMARSFTDSLYNNSRQDIYTWLCTFTIDIENPELMPK
jgi:hypothetical protein